MALLQPHKGYGYGYGYVSTANHMGASADSVPPAHMPADKPVEKPVTPSVVPEVKLPEIKEVPKSRRGIKPMAIPSPLPVQPIRIIKPKIIVRKLI
ncbi:hypothetical protein HF324_15070 [Chitinophaga oryzae]|uniref:Uncharacterized protein n=1 Tax=Chitinophaga oryzae TaxID=2725414 RepID=A0AAE7D7W1_9BACT|nr:hypothetical protein [Chitinophaga oryzae]QJB32656.1 hypothetical protein HF329_15540 [Chitinophaga oryzae]QJB39111.1 hypothetical protein HF324_15070 [Chitinophaga oryzae]